MAEGVTYVNDREIFPLEMPILFIRGIKNAYPDEATYRQIRRIDFMRGEETQIAGLSIHGAAAIARAAGYLTR